MLYKVIWIIEIDATDKKAAAQEALEIQRDVDSTANCFEVISTEDKTDSKFIYTE
jgi:flavin-binding protein dodecin